MRFEAIRLTGFRNLREVHLSLGPGIFVLLGGNAQGKTNFLEALFFLSRGFSPFYAHDEELISFGEQATFLVAHLTEGNSPFIRQVLLRRDGRKEWRRDGKLERKRLSLPLVGFFPEDLALADGEPKRRRDFLDRALAFLSPQAEATLGTYEKVLARRNLLLREGGPEELIEAYGEQLVALGTRIVEERLRYLHLFCPLLEGIYRNLSGSNEALRVEYGARGYDWREGVLAGLKKAREMLRREERERGMTLFGPHRDEILLLLGERDVREFASFGEKKSVVLALRVAEKAVIQWVRKGSVVLLLDDAFPGLDARRREALCSCVFSEAQVFLTTTEEDVALRLKGRGARVFFVEEGRIWE